MEDHMSPLVKYVKKAKKELKKVLDHSLGSHNISVGCSFILLKFTYSLGSILSTVPFLRISKPSSTESTDTLAPTTAELELAMTWADLA